ncbi:hypothetical protein [Corynebacterium pseudokroppenstedtii]|uniref:hypothetical protein n=1 Tax=Corynebacterium pseudokroppenstedtii TaxID=2804917 RepID=UPI00254C0DDB|nr:hypothetical protein [Corynebacterium pseudokroppenstedtii]MDK7146565.1 hypothetical protein [Corynebacterium pseudokroppenstedtii]
MVTTPDGGADSAPVSGAPRTHVSFVTKSAVVLLGMTALLNLYSTQPILGDIAAWAHIPTTDAAWTISTTTAGDSGRSGHDGSSDRGGVDVVVLSGSFGVSLCSGYVLSVRLRRRRGLYRGRI